MMTKNFCKISTLAAVLLLASCSTWDDMFSGDDNVILPGERISVLQLQKELAPSANMPAIALPDAWVNQFWPQAGGYPSHAMGHLALGKDLKKSWSRSIGAGGDRRTPLTAAPVVAENIVFTLDTVGDVAAFDLGTGKEKWRQSVVPRGEEDTGAVGGGIAYAAGRLYVTSGYKYLACIDPATGSLVWKASVPAPARSAPSVMDDKVYVMTLDNRLMVFNTADGAPLWNYAGVSSETNLLGSASPAVDASLVVLPLSSGEIFGLLPDNGQIAWQDNLSAVRSVGSMSSITDIRGLPVIDQGVVYAISYSGRMVAIDQVTGNRIWQREVGSAETPWAAGDAVYVISTEQHLVALSRRNGDIYWVSQLPRFEGRKNEESIIWSGPVLAGGRLFAASSKGELVEINPLDGKTIKKHELSGSVTMAPIVAGNVLLILADDGELTAYK